jgi:hypothetical protein
MLLKNFETRERPEPAAQRRDADVVPTRDAGNRWAGRRIQGWFQIGSGY